MVTASLLAALLSTAAPASIPLTASVLPEVSVGADGKDQGVGRGLRNMLIGGLVGGAGVGILVVASAMVVGTGLVIGLGFLFPPTALLAAGFGGVALTVVGLVASVLLMAGVATLLAGIVWFCINSVMVVLRLSPGYRPGPATDYLPD